jgi:general L-amino acid transport system permease protein
MTAPPVTSSSQPGGLGLLRRSARRSISTPLDAIVTVIVAALVVAIAIPLARWAVVDAVWSGTSETCRAAGGACWAFIGRKLEFILFGLYPPAERWRACGATAVLLALAVLTASPRSWRRWLVGAWLIGLTVAFWLMQGGAGLPRVPTRLWGGLPITLMLTAVGLALGFPLAVLLALARRSRVPATRVTATTFIEVVRGVPLIAVLYVAALVIPLAMPAGLELPKLLLAQAAVALFASAYLAEAVRSGLQMVPRGQRDAALALGLRGWQVNRLVILPQALRIVVPSFVSIAVGFFQDTSLVVIIGLFDLLNTARVAAQDSAWLGFHTEAYVFVGLIYFAGSTITSQYGLWLERRLHRDRRTATPATIR